MQEWVVSSDLFMQILGYIHINLDTFENASFSQSFSTLRQFFYPEKTYGCSCVWYYIPASMTENVLEISVLWQLCIRLIYGMAFVCELHYNKSKCTEKLTRYFNQRNTEINNL